MWYVCDVLYAVLNVCVSCFVVRGSTVWGRYIDVYNCDIGAHCCEVMYFGCFGFRGELGFLDCYDICVRVVNKQFELLKFVLDSVYVDLQ